MFSPSSPGYLLKRNECLWFAKPCMQVSCRVISSSPKLAKKVLQTVQEINGSTSCPVFVCSSTGHKERNKFIELNSEMDKPQNTFTQ